MKQFNKLIEEHTNKCKMCPIILAAVGAVFIVTGAIFSAAAIRGLWFLIGVIALVVGGYALYLTGSVPKPKAVKKEPKVHKEPAHKEEAPKEEPPKE